MMDRIYVINPKNINLCTINNLIKECDNNNKLIENYINNKKNNSKKINNTTQDNMCFITDNSIFEVTYDDSKLFKAKTEKKDITPLRSRSPLPICEIEKLY